MRTESPLLRTCTPHQQVSAGERACDDEGSGLDPIGNNTMTRTMQLLYTLHVNRVRTSAFNVCAHLVEQRRQVKHFRFARAILQHGLAVCQRRSHHQIFSSCHRDRFEHDACAF
jgi:hypothetical protein